MTSPKHISLAEYLKTDPQEIELWVEYGPLHLVGATLSYLTATSPSRSREHKVADVQATLEPLLEQTGANWGTWWKKVQPRVKESNHFSPGEARYTYRLKPGVSPEQVPVEPLATKPKAKKSGGSSSRKTTSAKSQAADLKQLRDSHAADLKQQRESHAADLEQQRKSHTADLKQQRDSHAAELSQQRGSHAADLEQQRKEHAADFQQWQGEKERLNYQVKSLWASIDSKMEQSRLAARKDMLLRIGDILQRAYHPANDPETNLAQVIAHLPLALRDGGAELLGEVGEVVAFNPSRHHPSQEIASGSLVRLTAPGVIILGGEAGDLVILKANVTPITEET